jgi:hypothetical protein
MNIDPNYIPPTLEEAIDYLYKCCDEKDLEFIRTEGKSEEEEMKGFDGKVFNLNLYGYTMHHGYGQMIRNAWGLWNGSELKNHFMERFGLGHADDMSGLIIEGLEAKVREQPYTEDMINDRVEQFKNHWITLGINPLTQQ